MLTGGDEKGEAKVCAVEVGDNSRGRGGTGGISSGSLSIEDFQ